MTRCGAAVLMPARFYRLRDSRRAMRDGSRQPRRTLRRLDLEHDAADLARKIACPTLVLWGNRLDKWYDVAQAWRERAESVTARALGCAHFLHAELTDDVGRALFFLLSVLDL